jgi:hypothetical protein
MEFNNFKKLMEEEEIRFGENLPRFERKFERSNGFINLVSRVMEVYLPKVVDVFVAMSGGKEEPKNSPPKRFTPDQGFEKDSSAPGQ